MAAGDEEARAQVWLLWGSGKCVLMVPDSGVAENPPAIGASRTRGVVQGSGRQIAQRGAAIQSLQTSKAGRAA